MSSQKLITTLSVQQEREIRLWFVLTSFLIVGTLIILCALDAIYFTQWRSLKTHYKKDMQTITQFDAVVARKKKLMESIALFNTQNNKLARYQKQLKNPHNILHALLQTAQKIEIDAIHIDHKKIRMQIHGSTEADLIAWSDESKKSVPLSHVQLQQLRKTSATMYSATIVAEIL